MGRSNRATLAVLLLTFLTFVTLNGCRELLWDTQSLLFSEFKRSEVMGLVAGFGTTFAAVPDLIAMLRRRSSAGMNPTMAAIMAAFQILWVYYGLLIASRPVVLWNVVAVLVNSLSVGAYLYFVRKEKTRQERKRIHGLLLTKRDATTCSKHFFRSQADHGGIGTVKEFMNPLLYGLRPTSLWADQVVVNRDVRDGSAIRGSPMNTRSILVCAAVFLASPLFGREKTDVIVMKNGDHITCEIKGLRSNTLYISVDYILSTLSVDWSKVDHVQSKQLFLVRTQDGTVYTGALATAETSGGRPLQIEISESPEEKVTLERKQVVLMNETSDNFWQRLNGHIGTGSTYSKGNDSAQYNLNSDVNYPRERWSAEARYTSNFTSSSGASTSTRNEVAFSARRLLKWNNWYYTGSTDLLQSSVHGIKLQSTFGGGVGRILKNTGSTSLTFYGGFAWQRINYHEAVLPSLTQHVSSGLIGSSLKLFRFDKTNLTLNASFLPAVSDPGRLHFNLNTSYYVKLWGKLDWNFTVYGSWDTRPPPSFSGSDYGTTSGLSLSFGNR